MFLGNLACSVALQHFTDGSEDRLVLAKPETRRPVDLSAPLERRSSKLDVGSIQTGRAFRRYAKAEAVGIGCEHETPAG
jgi:hypothetical protein